MQLVDHLAAGRLVQPVDVLGDHGLELACPLQLSQFQVGRVGLGPLNEHFLPVEAVKLLRVLGKEGRAEDGLRGIGVGLVVQSVHAAEVGDATFRGHPGAAEKDDVLALVNPFLQGSDLLIHSNLLAPVGAVSR